VKTHCMRHCLVAAGSVAILGCSSTDGATGLGGAGATGDTGEANGGGTSSGATGVGGVSTGGASSDATGAGGSSAGGASVGGAATGGSSTGGASSGGTNTGGSSTGGAVTGGASAGGASSGGTSTGGDGTVATGGDGTVATGGGGTVATGGDTTVGTGGDGTGGTGGDGTGGTGGDGTGGTGGDGTGGSAGNATGGSAGSTSSSGCGQQPPAQVPAQVDVNGTTGTFLVDVPAGYDPNTPMPIVFAFHGAGSSGETFRGQFYGNLLSTLSSDFIVVHPDALDGNAWDTATDIPFFDAMLALLSSTYCIDENRIFATGHSAGGFFSNNLGCERGDVLRAIAPVSGGGPFVFGGSSCNGQVAAWIAHGTNDGTVALTSGQDSRDYWLEANGCDINQTSVPSADYPCVEYGGCDVGYPVRWCEYDGGHEWPTFGPQGIYDFFSSF
jgi:polyhydroxybutyrate depolymerase